MRNLIRNYQQAQHILYCQMRRFTFQRQILYPFRLSLQPFQLLPSIIRLHPLRRNPVGIIPHRHIREMSTVVYPLFRPVRTIIIKLLQWPHHALEVRLVEVSERVPLGGVEPDFVGRGLQVRVGQVLQHVPWEDGEGVGHGGDVDPFVVVLVQAGGAGFPVRGRLVGHWGPDEQTADFVLRGDDEEAVVGVGADAAAGFTFAIGFVGLRESVSPVSGTTLVTRMWDKCTEGCACGAIHLPSGDSIDSHLSARDPTPSI